MSFISRSLKTLLIGSALATTALAATNPHVTAHPQARLTAKIDNTKVAPVPNTHPARLASLPDLGRVAPATSINHLHLLLTDTLEQEYALRSLLDNQQDKNSANYHQWMVPETFGAAFGADPSDIAKITDWLKASGLNVNSVMKNARVIDFGGTSAQIEATFHTEMHQYSIGGKTYISNSSDISLPKALSAVVIGVGNLNNFPPTTNSKYKGLVQRGADGQLHPMAENKVSSTGGGATPDVTLGSNHYIGGGDIPLLYDTKGLLAAGNDGTGVRVAILGQTDILLGDYQTYRSAFGLKPNNPNFIVIGQDPGIAPGGDDVESDLDVQASSAFAPGATIDFVTSGSDYFGGSVTASGFYIVENNTDDIMSLSYGESETDLGAAGNAELNFLWEQASSQGISVFVSSGDSGPDTYDDGAATGSKYTVSGFSSTPFNVAVGGTMMNEASGVTYWSTTNTLPGNVSALGYIPETVWNESTLDPYGAGAGYGGIVSESSGISFYYGTPSWQAGYGVPTTDPVPVKGSVTGPFVVPGPHRYQPDVALEAAGGHDGFLICYEGSCQVDGSGNLITAGVVGGTSVAAPSFAGVQALVDQKNGGRQGLPNYFYYALANQQHTAGTDCNSADLGLGVSANSGCSFHDIQVGNNFIPSRNGGTVANGNYIGWSAGPGFDMAIGLGSPDISNLATNWQKAAFHATTTTLQLTPTTMAYAANQSFSITVAPTSGTGTPTGDVSIIGVTPLYGAIGFATLSGGAASGTIPAATLEALPAGTYLVHAHYAGDTTFGGSDSAPIQVTIGTSTDSITAASYFLSPTTGALTPTSTYTYGQNIYFDAQVCNPAGAAEGLCNSGTPTGTITWTLNNGIANLPTSVSTLDSFDDTYFLSGLGLVAYDINPTYAVLPGGVYTVNSKYSGDTTFNAVAGTPFTITVNPTATTMTATAVTTEVASGATATINVAMSTFAGTNGENSVTPAAAGVVSPSGTVTFTDSVQGALGNGTLAANGSVVFNTNLLTTAGAHVITCTYNGDKNYAATTGTGSKTVTITVGGTTAPTPVVTFSANNVQVLTSVTITATVASPATGNVSLYDGTTLLRTATLSTTTHTITYAIATLTAGVHNITAVYGGSTTYSSSTSAVTPLTILQNVPTVYMQAPLASAASTAGVALNVTITPHGVALYGANASNPAPVAPVNYYDNNGATLLGSAPTAYFSQSGLYLSNFTTKGLAPGTHVLVAQYTGDTNYATVQSNTQTINIGLTSTTITSVTPSTNIGAGTGTFTVKTLTVPLGSGGPAVGGTIAIYDGAVKIGSGTVTNGVGTGTAVDPNPPGTHIITVVYSGDANYYTSTTAVGYPITTVTPGGGGFTYGIVPNPITIVRGQAGILTATITGTNNYTGTFTFSCSGLPAYTSCASTPITFTATGSQTQSAAISIITSPLTPVGSGGFLWIPALLLAGFLGLRRKQLGRGMKQTLALVMILCGAMSLSGCAKVTHYGVQGGTPLGTTPVTITATGVGTGFSVPSTTLSATVSVTVVAQ